MDICIVVQMHRESCSRSGGHGQTILMTMTEDQLIMCTGKPVAAAEGTGEQIGKKMTEDQLRSDRTEKYEYPKAVQACQIGSELELLLVVHVRPLGLGKLRGRYRLPFL